MVVALNSVRNCLTHQVGQKSTHKSIFTKHKVRLGKAEEEKEEAETCARNFHIKNSSLLPGSWCNLKGNRQFYKFSRNIYGTVYKFTQTFSPKFFQKSAFPSKGAAKINLFLVHFRMFCILTIRKHKKVYPFHLLQRTLQLGALAPPSFFMPHFRGKHVVWNQVS